jgi:hypothetical protein
MRSSESTNYTSNGLADAAVVETVANNLVRSLFPDVEICDITLNPELWAPSADSRPDDAKRKLPWTSDDLRRPSNYSRSTAHHLRNTVHLAVMHCACDIKSGDLMHDRTPREWRQSRPEKRIPRPVIPTVYC